MTCGAAVELLMTAIASVPCRVPLPAWRPAGRLASNRGAPTDVAVTLAIRSRSGSISPNDTHRLCSSCSPVIRTR